MFDREQEEEQLSLPLPDGVLTQNIRVPLLVCVNKSDLQSQVLREESTSKILVILYHLRSLCIKCNSISKCRWRFVDLYLDQEQLQHQCALLVHHPSHLLVPFQVPLGTAQLRSHIHPSRLRQAFTRQVTPTLTKRFGGQNRCLEVLQRRDPSTHPQEKRERRDNRRRGF